MMTRLTIKDVQSLEQRFPYMFSGQPFGMTYFKGWFPDFVDLCFELDRVLGDSRQYFRWIQIKEKFGQCRMHYSLAIPLPAIAASDQNDGFINPDGESDDPDKGGEDKEEDIEEQAEPPDPHVLLKEEVWRRLRIASDKINARCMVCGDAATTERYGFWLATLCSYHHPNAREARGDTRTLDELTAVLRVPAGDSDGGTGS